MKKFTKVYEEENKFETENDILFKKINEFIAKLPYLKGLEANRYTVEEYDDYYVVLGKKQLDDIINKHSDQEQIGSYFSKEVDVYELREIIMEIMKEKRPTEVSNKIYKWLGTSTDIELGMDCIKKTDDLARIKSLKDYKIVITDPKTKTEKTEKIKVSYEEGRKTKSINIIAEEIGKIEDLPVLAVVSTYPGKTGIEIKDRTEFALYGYYFCSKSKLVEDMYEIE